MSRSLVRCLLASLLFACVGGMVPGGAPRRAYAAPNPFTALDVPYTRDFAALANSGTANAWTDNMSPLNGWYESDNTATTYRAGDGSANNGDLHSFGTGTNADRALGSVASGATATLFYGVRFVNNTGAAIPDLRV
ncbi:MAG TPA: hypothetical protein VD886_24290 [Herpetosiphonaceae bacterium]|nr:hypothetical protein [Herpetosiphonaceae bacterium]